MCSVRCRDGVTSGQFVNNVPGPWVELLSQAGVSAVTVQCPAVSKYAGNLCYACKALWDILTIIDTLPASCISLPFSLFLSWLCLCQVGVIKVAMLRQLVSFCVGKTASKFCSHIFLSVLSFHKISSLPSRLAVCLFVSNSLSN